MIMSFDVRIFFILEKIKMHWNLIALSKSLL